MTGRADVSGAGLPHVQQQSADALLLARDAHQVGNVDRDEAASLRRCRHAQ